MFNDKWIFFLSLLSLNLCFLICFLFLNSWKAFFLFWFLMISFSELLKKEFKIFLKFEFLNFWKFLFLNFEPPPPPFYEFELFNFSKKNLNFFFWIFLFWNLSWFWKWIFVSFENFWIWTSSFLKFYALLKKMEKLISLVKIKRMR